MNKISTVLILSKHTIGRMVESSYDTAGALEKVFRSTLKVTLSKEQMSRAKSNSNLRNRTEQKAYSMLMSKARNIRKTGSGRNSSLLRTQSAFVSKPKRKNSPLNSRNEQTLDLDDVTDTKVDDMGQELERIDADRAGGGV